ncbi:MAG TPA: SusC/RagA family TonB-linked outer membrane protein [Gemmatimonadaceae bacterium]|jgi:TonB-linked SusC/RagA family outer membrane protein
MRITWCFRRALAGLFLVAAGAGSLAAQNTGSISGTVTDAGNGQPLNGVRVLVAGTALQGTTDLRGIYRIANVPAGEVRLSVRRIAYKAAEKVFTLAAGQESTQNFALTGSAVTLEEVVVTGTAGDQKRKAQGAQVSEISVSDVLSNAPVRTFEQVLQSRSPGVSVTLASGTSGAFSSIRIRGGASISLSNEPLIYVDGIQIASGSGNTFGVGGQATGRLSELNPQDFESVEIVKGPAAATLYGANASAGVIQIITKKGRQGSRMTQSLFVTHDNVEPAFTPPSNYAFCTPATIAPASTNPLCRGKTTTTLVSDNPLVRESAFRTGNAQDVQWSGRGGGTNFGYYISGNYGKENGTTPNNGFDRRGGRVNFNFTPTSKLSFDANVGMNRANFVLPDNDNNVYGYLGGGLLGTPLTRTDNGSGSNGWFGAERDVKAIRAIENDQQTHRTISTATVNYVPLSWWTHRVVVGADWLRDETRRFFPKNSRGSYQGLSNTGDINENREGEERYTFDYLSNMRLSTNQELTHNVSVGFQTLDRRDELVRASGQGLTVNSNNTVSAAASKSAAQDFTQQRQVGFLGQYQAAWKDRLFGTLGARIDANSSFGDRREWFFLPKAGVSYVISEEPFWRERFGFVNTLRLRGAWGQTGRSPTPGSALQTLAPAPYILAGIEQPGATPNSPGNDSLKAERGIEIETGFDASVLEDRVGLEVTYYRKTSKDLLLQKPLPPSLGFPANQAPFVNIGELRNSGFEVAVNAQPIQGRDLNWDVRLGIATLNTKITDMGTVPAFGTLNRFEKGHEPGMFVGLRIRSIDTVTNIVTVSDDFERIGPVLPTLESSFSTGVTIRQNFRVSGLIDGKFGNYLYNLTDFFRETQLVRSNRRLDPTVLSKYESLRRYGNQAAGQPAFVREGKKPGFAATATVNEVRDAYVQKADFIKLRELSASYTIPDEWAKYLRTERATLTLAGRNLHTWTDYEGFDPELLSVATTNFGRQDFLTLPPQRRVGLSINLTF